MSLLSAGFISLDSTFKQKKEVVNLLICIHHNIYVHKTVGTITKIVHGVTLMLHFWSTNY
jgi:hypothetical protein